MNLPRTLRGAVLLALLLAAWPHASFAQIDGQVTEFTIQTPDPATAATDPFRTSQQWVNIEFSHNGATGSYFINTDGAEIEGSTFIGDPGTSSGTVAAGFLNDGTYSVGLVLFQTRLNITFQTLQNTRIQYDKTPPTWDISTITIDGGPDSGGLAPQAFVPGTVYYTHAGEITVAGTVVDPNGGSPPEECNFAVTGLTNPEAPSAWAEPNGAFSHDISISGPDGEYRLQITAEDSFNGSNDDPSGVPNVSAPIELRIIKDTVLPVVQDIKIIRHFEADNEEILSPGPNTYVGAETVVIRVEMSEKMEVPPRLSITQDGGSEIQASILTDKTIDDRIFFYSYGVIATAGLNGPASIHLTGQYDGPLNQPDFGYDLARNPMDEDQRDNQFIVDTIAPTLIRYADNAGPGNVISIPADGSQVSRENFPQVFQVYLEDYDKAGATDNASGVDFSRLNTGSTGGTNSTTGLRISLTAPNNTDVPGTPSVSPPNGVFLTLVDWSDPTNGMEGHGFQETAEHDGTLEPVPGIWRIRVEALDKVGNTSVQTILFRVDNTPINAADLLVYLDPAADTGNPLPLTGSCIGIEEVSNEWPRITVMSNDATFVSSRTQVQFFSLVDGRNSQPEEFVIPPSGIDRTNPTSVVISEIHRPGLSTSTDSWPLPDPAPPAAYVPFGMVDPRVGQWDGLYKIRVTPVDQAGNHGVTHDGRRWEYQDYEVTLDTTDPYTAWTFPAANSAINEPLRFVDAVVVDPAAPNGNEGCGINIQLTEMIFLLEQAYRPDDFDASYIEGNNPLPPINNGKLRGVVRFIHNPNNTDPTQPSFHPNDDTYRVLLEVVDNYQVVRSLKSDGSMDGIYSIAVDPIDKAGNSLDVDLTGDSAPDRGNYYGLKQSSISTIDLVKFVFLYDTIEPEIDVNDFPDDSYIGGSDFVITGTTRDLSAKADDQTKGGAGILKVEYKLEVVDRNGIPIDGNPAEVITTGNNNDQGILWPAQENPVIPWKNAWVEPIKLSGPHSDTASNDPVRTTTFPMTSAFADSQRERRAWRINGRLPSDAELLKPRQSRSKDYDRAADTSAEDYYRLTIRTWDRAGNYTDIVRRVQVSLDHLNPPVLQEPACGAYTNRLATTFKWMGVSGAVEYVFRLYFPDGNLFTRRVTNTQTMFNLSREGEYRWQVAAVDSAGNQGAFSSLCSLVLDRTPPEVTQFIITGKSLTPKQNGKIFLGEFTVEMEFSEPLNQNHKIAVFFDPLGGLGAPAQAITTMTWINTAGESNWTGSGRIPDTAVPSEWDGGITFVVEGATDMAGNPMQRYYNANFEIDTGPYFDSKYFASLMNEEEFTVVIVGTEDLLSIPTVSEMKGVEWQGAFHGLQPMLGSQKTYWGTMKLINSSVTNVSFELSATDLDQNSSKRKLSFTVSRPQNSSSTSTVNSALMALTFPANSISRAAPVYMFPPSAQDSTPSDQSGELLDIAPLADVQAPHLGINGDLVIEAGIPESSPVPADSKRIGVYGWFDKSWHFLGNTVRAGKVVAKTTRLGQFKLAADLVGPRIELLSHEEGSVLESSRPLIQARVVDKGSGVDVSSLVFMVDGHPVQAEFDPETSLLTYRPDRDLDAGTHSIRVAASDLSGNPGSEIAVSMLAPDGFGFAGKPLAWPNPARVNCRIRYNLSQPASTSSVVFRLYDSAGRRIRTLTASGAFAGTNDISWDLTDRRGRTVANGVYFYRARATSVNGSSDSFRGKIAVLR